jgi:hypothetical protein
MYIQITKMQEKVVHSEPSKVLELKQNRITVNMKKPISSNRLSKSDQKKIIEALEIAVKHCNTGSNLCMINTQN